MIYINYAFDLLHYIVPTELNGVMQRGGICVCVHPYISPSQNVRRTKWLDLEAPIFAHVMMAPANFDPNTESPLPSFSKVNNLNRACWEVLT